MTPPPTLRIDDLPLLRKGMLLVALPLIAVLLAAGLGIYFSLENANSRELVDHSLEVRREVWATRSAIEQVWSQQLESHLASSVGSTATPRVDIDAANAPLARLAALVSDNKDQSERVAKVAVSLSDIEARLKTTNGAEPGIESHQAIIPLVLGLREKMDRALALVDEIYDEEQALLVSRVESQTRFRWLTFIALGVAVWIGVGAMIASGIFMTRGLVRRLAELGALAPRWASGDIPEETAAVPKDEIGRLHGHLLDAARLAHKRTLELDESRRDFQAVMDNMTSILFIKNLDGSYHFVNRQYEQLVGVSLDELRRTKRPTTLSNEDVENLYKWDRAVIADNIAIQSEDTLHLLDRDLVFLSTRFPLPNADGSPRLLCGISTDITERKRALDELELYRASLENRVELRTRELSLETEAHLASNRKLRSQVLRMQLLNQLTKLIAGRHDLRSLFQSVLLHLRDELPIACGVIFHFESGSDILVVGASLDDGCGIIEKLDLAPGSTTRVGHNGIRRSLAGETINVVEAPPSGEGVLAELGTAGLSSLMVVPLRAFESTHGVMVVGRPEAGGFESSEAEFLTQLGEHIAIAVAQLKLLDELKSKNRDLRDAQDHMAQQERLRAMGEMASGIAHDINNALGPVTVYADILLEDQKLDEESTGYVRIILSAAEGIAETVSRLRHFYRPAEELATLANLNLNSMIQEVASLTRPRWRDIPQSRGQTITLELELAPDLPTLPGWDGDMRSVITNLIFNAVDATSGDGTIKITTYAQEGYAVVEVKDTGCGMDEQTRKHCLEPFFTTKGEKGTGLGLPMVYGIVARHEGRVEIESELGLGTTVRLHLSTKPRSIQEAIVASLTGRRTTGLRLLCVDDDPTIRESLRSLLSRDGHTTLLAESGPTALELCEREQAAGKSFDLVITDLGMPKMDGREFALKIRERYPVLPIILLTGWGSQLIEHRDSITGFAEILAKPPRIAELRAAITKAMDGHAI